MPTGTLYNSTINGDSNLDLFKGHKGLLVFLQPFLSFVYFGHIWMFLVLFFHLHFVLVVSWANRASAPCTCFHLWFEEFCHLEDQANVLYNVIHGSLVWRHVDGAVSGESIFGQITMKMGLKFLFKSPCLQFFSDSRDTFPKSSYYVVWPKSILKLAIWHVPQVSGTCFGLATANSSKIGKIRPISEIWPSFLKNGLRIVKDTWKW